MSDVQITDFQSNFERDLLPLFQTYFTQESQLLHAGYLEWLYLRNPNGPAKAVFISEGGKWIAFMALVPVVLARAGERMKGYFVVNVLVDPAHQGKNLFGKMIRAARDFTQAEGSALMGHPNRLALKMWQRARMHFQEPLKPALILPSLWRSGRVLRTFDGCAGFCAAVNQRTASQSRWHLELTPEFLTWRFLQHPVHKYACYMHVASGADVALDVSRRWRAGVHLLIDTFYAQNAARALAGLPYPALAMRPASAGPDERRALKVPGKKEFPFFFTPSSGTIDAGSAVDLRLAASDF